MQKGLFAIGLLAVLLLGCTGAREEGLGNAPQPNGAVLAENTSLAPPAEEIPREIEITGSTPAEEAYGINGTETASPQEIVFQNLTESTLNETPAVEPPEPKVIVKYFYSRICPFSRNASIYINELEKEFGEEVRFEKYNIYWNPKNYSLYLNYTEAWNISNESRVVPMVFIGNESFSGPEIREKLKGKIEEVIE